MKDLSPHIIHRDDEKSKREIDVSGTKNSQNDRETHKKGTWSVWITNHCVDNRKYLLENNHKVVIDSLIDL